MFLSEGARRSRAPSDNNRKQIYGTQLSTDKNGEAFTENLIDIANVNVRRKTMGMEAVEEYLLVVNTASRKLRPTSFSYEINNVNDCSF